MGILNFKGIKEGGNGIPLHHLQNVDDTIFFEKWNLRNAKNLMRIMKCFEDASVLKINRNKIKVFGVGIPENEVLGFARGMGCVPGKLPSL